MPDLCLNSHCPSRNARRALPDGHEAAPAPRSAAVSVGWHTLCLPAGGACPRVPATDLCPPAFPAALGVSSSSLPVNQVSPLHTSPRFLLNQEFTPESLLRAGSGRSSGPPLPSFIPS